MNRIAIVSEPTSKITINQEDFDTFISVGKLLAEAADERLNTIYAKVSVERDAAREKYNL